MKLIVFLKDVNTGYKKGSMYEFIKHDREKDVFKINGKMDYVHCSNRGDTYMIINNPSPIDRLQFAIIRMSEYLQWDVNNIHEDIKNKTKEELIEKFIKMKELILLEVENKIIDLLIC